MIRKSLPIVIFGVIGLLSAAAIEFLPETLYFPVVEYSTSDNIRVVMLTHGAPDKAGCEQSAGKLAIVIRANCPNCKYAERCSRGLDEAQKKIMSREPLVVPSLRTRGGGLFLTVAAPEPQTALAVCKLMEQQSASLPVEKRLTCFPAMASR